MNSFFKNFRKRQFKPRLDRFNVIAKDAQSSQLRTPHSALRTGFTLIELLVVIAIIGLLAALIVGGASLANTHKAKARVTTERDALVTAIERYKKAKGFYPPDYPTDPTCVQTSLFYELTGTTFNSTAGTFQSLVTGEILNTNQIGTLFGNSGFINSSSDSSSPAQNFYTGIKNQQHLLVVGSGNNNYSVLGVPISGPINLNAAPGTIGTINPWHYNYSHPTNNHDSFDLWMDVKYGGKTNRISNWSAEPQPL